MEFYGASQDYFIFSTSVVSYRQPIKRVRATGGTSSSLGYV